MKIASIVGARPQFIKCAPVSRELRNEHEEILIHTGQHYDHGMSEVFFEELAIPKPDYNLGIGSGTHGRQTGAMLGAIEDVLEKEKPDVVLVYGDTNSTLAGALAAAKLHVPVAHIEAGLRSFDRGMPEEVNRVLTDHASDLLFCPTETAIRNLGAEGITKGVHLVGDVMVDAMNYNRGIAEERSRILEDVGVEPGGYLVVTVHRPSNTDDRENMAAILGALAEAGKPAVFPVHPRTRKCLGEYGVLAEMPENVRLIEPLGYLDMIRLMAHAEKILTDSGGVQKEAYMLGVPCITLRENTEWVETVEAGWNVLVGAGREKIVDAIRHFSPGSRQKEIFGNGNASVLIGKILARSQYARSG
ncbi:MULTISPECIES: non-hydrolyzing UDP-N-acetylglucosamine 2-epimerase [Methanoculleus]|uniref:UDP-N-acetylglucosamine 2-epimerase n=2 Tax=Methanoculleus TaxID=45989 RepID=A3CVY4_METMJ|nr:MULTISPECIES: UDP-N-acetylglucosamine 2-epimerase (non-hydrolyzing) [Methanoculleus]ABN57534.1 UDP-N-acetylglucosamine 2-epimerase [Methanoculleus marisnigri JR1]MCC7554882.1 UDP-N-acetylglucosamine 2-epimerase (non-hydrolyzing) [Methanoculleus marisnigri]UYU18937.1 UDP-N-acetylglucosamine 2-epimerase (non-hydrolyzing) [Methanoculleus submarinus]